MANVNKFFFLLLLLIILFPKLARATIYPPGATLVPDCAPGSPNCGVSVGSLADLTVTNPISGVTTGNEVPLTFLNGLTRTANAVANNLITGISGGQSVIGGTDVTDILKLQGTTGNGTLASPAIQAVVGNNGATTALTILNNGNVGVGTTGPGEKLQVAGGNILLDNNQNIKFYSSGGVATSMINLDGSNNFGLGNAALASSLYLKAGSGSSILVQTGANYPLVANTNGVTINGSGPGPSSGNGLIVNSGSVGIGTANPSQILEVLKTAISSSVTGLRLVNPGNNTTNSAVSIDFGISNADTEVQAQIKAIRTGEGNTDSSALTFSTRSSSVLKEAMRINYLGFVGIGTASPAGKLHVYSSAAGVTANSLANQIVIEKNGDAGLSILTPNANIGRIFFGSPSNSAGGQINYYHTSDSLGLATGGTDKVTVDSNGNVGIGTASPGSKLDVNGSANFSGALTGATSYNGLVVTSNTGVITAGTWSGTTIALNKGGTGTSNGSITGTGALSFTSSGINALNLDSGTTGNINIGTNNNSKNIFIGNNFGTTALQLNAGSGGIFLNGAGAATAGNTVLCLSASNQIFSGTSATTCDPSSARFKHDITDIGLGLNAVNALHPVSYVYNSNNQPALGFIAEEAAQVDERLIVRDKNGTIEAINPDAFTPILTRAIQEMSTKIDKLNSEVSTLQMQLDALKNNTPAPVVTPAPTPAPTVEQDPNPTPTPASVPAPVVPDPVATDPAAPEPDTLAAPAPTPDPAPDPTSTITPTPDPDPATPTSP